MPDTSTRQTPPCQHPVWPSLMSPLSRPPPLHAQVYEMSGSELKLVSESEKPSGLKCATFGASSAANPQLATGNFDGKLQVRVVHARAGKR